MSREKILKAMADFIYLHYRLVIIAGIFISIVMGYFYSKLELHLNFIDLLNKNDPVVKMYDYASKNFGALSFLFLVLESDDLEKAKLYAQKLLPRLTKHKKFVKRVYYKYDYEFFRDHLLYFLPEKDLAELGKFLAENEKELAQLWSAPGILNLLNLLDHSLYQILMRGELPEEELQGKANLLKPIDLIFDQLEKSIKGEKIDFYQLKKELAQNFTAQKDLFRVSVIVLCIVFVVIFLSYRGGFWHTLLTMLPLVFGSISMVGIMNLLKIKFNFINIGMIPLIIGISIDYGVYVVQRWIGEGKGEKSIPKVVESTGRAVALSALTTIIGFGSIIIARYQGLSIMGKTLVIGVGCALVSAVLMLPSLLLIIEKIKSKN